MNIFSRFIFYHYSNFFLQLLWGSITDGKSRLAEFKKEAGSIQTPMTETLEYPVTTSTVESLVGQHWLVPVLGWIFCDILGPSLRSILRKIPPLKREYFQTNQSYHFVCGVVHWTLGPLFRECCGPPTAKCQMRIHNTRVNEATNAGNLKWVEVVSANKSLGPHYPSSLPKGTFLPSSW